MGLLNLFTKTRDSIKQKKSYDDPPILESEAKYYQPDEYYTDTVTLPILGSNGKYITKKVVTFDERKKTCKPSRNGLYVAEILLLHYCSYGTYPHPKNGYPGFWWFEYGIRDIGSVLTSLENRKFIRFASANESLPNLTVPELKELLSEFDLSKSGKKSDLIKRIQDNINTDTLESKISERKYILTAFGKQELKENEYVPYMHKHKKKTIEGSSLGPEFNVWAVNKKINVNNTSNWRQIVDEMEEKIG
ncbi:MAG: SAP domain-containing protein [Lachnospiraceae bacterium]|nr:SAP domain-containing protein [Lachnospiraceae bacterium]